MEKTFFFIWRQTAYAACYSANSFQPGQAFFRLSASQSADRTSFRFVGRNGFLADFLSLFPRIILTITTPVSQRSVPGGDVRVFQAQQVPCSFPCLPSATGDYLFKEPRLVFDPLSEYSGEPVRLNSSYSRIFWVDVFVPVGSSNLTLDITCTSRNGTIQAQTQIPIHVVPTALGPQKVRHTEWFYSDCLCYQYGCTMFSEEFFEIARKYILCAAQHGVDTLLTPVFTPSLDIEHGDRRMPGQLVQITKTESGFSFDFSLLEKWVSVALECGIEWFEIAPFFTQWGAKYAAEIYCNTPTGLKLFSAGILCT